MWRYTMNAQTHAAEFAAEALQAYDGEHEELRDAIEQAMKNMSYRQWVEWRHTNADQIKKLARSTPSQRKRRKNPPEALLYLATHQLCREAALLMEACEHLAPGTGYRDTTAYAGAKAHELAHDVIAVQTSDLFEEPLKFSRT